MLKQSNEKYGGRRIWWLVKLYYFEEEIPVFFCSFSAVVSLLI